MIRLVKVRMNFFFLFSIINIFSNVVLDAVLNKIVLYFNLKKNELAHLEKLLKKLPKKKYGPLTVNQAHKILSLHKKDDEEVCFNFFFYYRLKCKLKLLVFYFF